MGEGTSPADGAARALALYERQQYPEALVEIDRALAADPALIEGHNVRGLVLVAMGDVVGGIAAYDRVLAVAPRHADGLTNRGSAFLLLHRYDDAMRDLTAAVAVQPTYVNANLNLARAYLIQNRIADALAAYQHTLVLAPGDPKTLWALGVAQLLAGDFVNGWANYNWRWRAPDFGNSAPRDFGTPRYTGAELLAGKTLFVHAEQGFGDSIQFCRYIPLLAARRARVLFMVQDELRGLFAASHLPCELFTSGSAVPPWDYDLPLMNAPAALGTTLTTIPAAVPYLAVPAEKTARWHALLGPRKRPRIGIAWSGRRSHGENYRRSMTIEALAPIFALDADVHVLQTELSDAERAFLADKARLIEPAPRDFGDTAAHIAAMDHVLTVDTSLAHLAGALARPVSILLSAAPDFRWLLDRSDSPWYPTATLFRQSRLGVWDDTIAQAMAHVAAAIKGRPVS